MLRWGVLRWGVLQWGVLRWASGMIGPAGGNVLGSVVTPGTPKLNTALQGLWKSLLDFVCPPEQIPVRLAVPAPEALLTGTVTPRQVKRALLVDHTPAEATAALATLVQTRAVGGRALRKNIRLQTVQSTGGGQAGGGRAGGVRAGGVAEARALIKLALQAEPGRGAGPAARSLLRARLGGQLPMDQYGAAALGAFFHGNGYIAPGMAAMPNGLPFNITEADQEAARLMARASGAWHPRAAYRRPADAEIPVALIDDGFNTVHPLLAPKLSGRGDVPYPELGASSPTLHTPENAKDHGTAVAVILSGNTHAIDVRPVRYDLLVKPGVTNIASLTPLAAWNARIVNVSVVDRSKSPETRAAIAAARIDAMRQAPRTLFVQAAGNREPDETPAEQEGNLEVSGQPNILTVSGLDCAGHLSPADFVYDPVRVDTLAAGCAYVPELESAAAMTKETGTSLASPVAANLAALMLALAPNLSTVRIKAVILGTILPTTLPTILPGTLPGTMPGTLPGAVPLELAIGPGVSAYPPIDRGRALRVAALEGLMVSGTADQVRSVTIATVGGARQERRGGRGALLRPGMTAEQAADALKLRGPERAQALADHARLLSRGRP